MNWQDVDFQNWRAEQRQREQAALRAVGVRGDVIRESRRHGRVCGRCGHTLLRTMHVRRANVCGFTALFCRSCADKLWPDYHWSARVTCKACGRPFMHPSHVAWHQEPQTCCVGCANALAYNPRRVTPSDRPCVVCGESFTAKRSDAKTCGPTCRQKLRRRSKAATTAG
jgi:hypothetical protein